MKQAKEYILNRKKLSILTGIMIGVALGIIFGGTQTGGRGLTPSFVVDAGNFAVHLHHWMWAGATFLMMVKVEKINSRIKNSRYYNLLLGIPIGAILQGILMYGDWHRIIIY